MGATRIGFAGAGFIAGIHAGILAGDARVRVRAVFDPNPQRAAMFALKTDAAQAPSFDDLVSDIDALYICTPNALHADLAVRALDAGIHVFSEKPMATSVAAARAVAAAAARSRAVYQAGFNRRFASVYVALKSWIERGELTPTSALLKMHRGELQQPLWTGDPAVSGGYLYETPIHMLDMARHLFGEPVDLVCRARASVYDELDDFSMMFTFDGGWSAVFASSAHTTWLFPFERVEVYGAHMTAATEEMERVTFAAGVGAAAETLDFAQQPLELRWGYGEEDRRFIDAIHGDGEVAVGAADALATTELVARCYVAAVGSIPPTGPT